MCLEQVIVTPKFVLKSVPLMVDCATTYNVGNPNYYDLQNIPQYTLNSADAPVYTKPLVIYAPVVFTQQIIPVGITSAGQYQVMHQPHFVVIDKGVVAMQRRFEVDVNASTIMARFQAAIAGQPYSYLFTFAAHVSENFMLPSGSYQFTGIDTRPSELLYLELNY